MKGYSLYLLVAFGTFMSHLYSPTFGSDAKVRLVFETLFFGDRKERILEACLLSFNVFAGAGLAFVLLEPNTARMAVTAGLGWTSAASIARAAYQTGIKKKS